MDDRSSLTCLEPLPARLYVCSCVKSHDVTRGRYCSLFTRAGRTRRDGTSSESPSESRGGLRSPGQACHPPKHTHTHTHTHTPHHPALGLVLFFVLGFLLTVPVACGSSWGQGSNLHHTRNQSHRYYVVFLTH